MSINLCLYTDGGSRGNPGPAALAFLITNPAGEVLHAAGEFIGTATNNEAEYHALLRGLEVCLRRGEGSLQWVSDSELVVKQLRGEYKVRDVKLKPLFERAKVLVGRFTHVECEHRARSEPLIARADRLLNAVLDATGA
jgi:ribonuclease HI